MRLTPCLALGLQGFVRTCAASVCAQLQMDSAAAARAWHVAGGHALTKCKGALYGEWMPKVHCKRVVRELPKLQHDAAPPDVRVVVPIHELDILH